jgi:hypothetical protein
MAPAVRPTPRDLDHKEVSQVAIVKDKDLKEEVKRTILRESLTRYRNAMADDEERMLLQDRINRLKRQLGLA